MIVAYECYTSVQAGDNNAQDIVVAQDDLGVTHVDGLSTEDLERVRSLALIDLTALFDMHGVTYARRKAKSRGRGQHFCRFAFLSNACDTRYTVVRTKHF